jgi:hypothetical protein
MTKGKYIRTKETLERLANSHKGKKLSEETRRKISEQNRGKVRSEEYKKNLSNKLKGRHINPKTEFKNGMKAWNTKNKIKLKRKFVRKNGKFQLNAHYVFCSYYNLDSIPKGFVIHHKDGNSLNDSRDNLVMMTDKAHKEYHNKIAKQKFIAGEKLI